MNCKKFGVSPCIVVLTMFASAPAWAFTARFSWVGVPACSGTSPAFTLSAVPKATTRLRFKMMDFDAPNFNHGGSTIDYGGKGSVSAGAVSYIGPCPPGGQKHRYVWIIEALDAAGMVLGKTETQGVFPP